MSEPPQQKQAATKDKTKKPDAENNMHDKCKQVIMAHNNLSKFFKALKGLLPECSATVKEAIAHYKGCTRLQYLTEVQKLLQPHIEYISQYDEALFMDEYVSGPLYLLPRIDFKVIWHLLETEEEFTEDEALQRSSKKTIFNHMQTIYVSTEMALNQISVFNRNVEKQRQFLMDMLGNLKLDDSLKERVEQLKAAEKAAEGESGFSLGKLADVFGEDNFIYQLAQDIAKELDLGNDDIENPVDAITGLFANGGKKIRELIVMVTDKVEDKVRNGEIDRDKLMADARKVKDKIKGCVPGLDKMFRSSGMTETYKAKWDGLSDERKQYFTDIPELLERGLLDWTEEENDRFTEFTAELGESWAPPAEEPMPDTETEAPKAAPKPTRAARRAGVRTQIRKSKP